MRIYCKPEHLHSFVQGVIDAAGSTEGVDILPLYGLHNCINHYCIRIDLTARQEEQGVGLFELSDRELDTVMKKVTHSIHKVIDSWVTGEAIEYREFLVREHVTNSQCFC